MKRFLVSWGILAVIVLILSPQTSLCAPKAQAHTRVYDAGEVPQGKTISNEFLLKNTGDELLVFKVRPC
jgi:hypothetical protein